MARVRIGGSLSKAWRFLGLIKPWTQTQVEQTICRAEMVRTGRTQQLSAWLRKGAGWPCASKTIPDIIIVKQKLITEFFGINVQLARKVKSFLIKQTTSLHALLYTSKTFLIFSFLLPKKQTSSNDSAAIAGSTTRAEIASAVQPAKVEECRHTKLSTVSYHFQKSMMKIIFCTKYFTVAPFIQQFEQLNLRTLKSSILGALGLMKYTDSGNFLNKESWGFTFNIA